MNTLKHFLLIEFNGMFMCGIAHLLSVLIEGFRFHLMFYFIVAVTILIVFLLTIYVFEPLERWFLG